ncbi:MAG TPA: YbaB/EbfC family nucleoid-associated protein [bacterium]|jgi:DNA-binding protein YbaB|nr:YbaB/EbfC family nucleoid-associated protein [bacterium]HOG38061.1 YbaB/EbfC family nucleoid-associated protein [bacterium]HQI03117.1 YbaB/EbfC family nucleoid-associated protein [bacterium]
MSLFSKLNQIKDLRTQAKQMQNVLSQETVEVEKNGIKIKMDANQKILNLSIPDGIEKSIIESTIPNLINDGNDKVRKILAEKMRSGDISIPDFKF